MTFSYKKITYTILLITVLTGCYDPDDDAIRSEEVIELTSNENSILADAASTLDLYAYIPEEASKDKTTINLEITKGTFIDNNEKKTTVKADSTGQLNNVNKKIAKIRIRSDNTEGAAIVKASIENFTDTLIIQFTKALPEAISVATSAFYVYSDFKSEITVSAQLLRKTGKPSTGAEVRFEVHAPDGSVLSESINFREEKLRSDDLAKVSAIYSPGNINYTGFAFVIASANNGNIKPDTTSIYIYPPEENK